MNKLINENLNKLETKISEWIYVTPKDEISFAYSGESIINGKSYYRFLMVRGKPSANRLCSCPKVADYLVINELLKKFDLIEFCIIPFEFKFDCNCYDNKKFIFKDIIN